MGKWRVTYDVTTEESAENGDFAESGFAMPGGWRYPQTPGVPSRDDFGMSLREAVRITGLGFEDGGRSFYSINPRQDHVTGMSSGDLTYAIHPPRTITPASYRRVARILKAS